ncbi:MAG: ribbon-helix-helix protein, CopG family [Sulfuricurvum sp.]|jgi:metal-responsive CopG/Arc/MetJ family transcriptional regulator
MHTITLKADDDFFAMLNSIVKKLGTSRSKLIRDAVLSYNETLEKEKLKEQIKKASMLTRADSLNVADKFETALADGLESV